MEMVKASANKAHSTQSVVKFFVGMASIVIMIAISAMTVIKTNQAVSDANSSSSSASVQVVSNK